MQTRARKRQMETRPRFEFTLIISHRNGTRPTQSITSSPVRYGRSIAMQHPSRSRQSSWSTIDTNSRAAILCLASPSTFSVTTNGVRQELELTSWHRHPDFCKTTRPSGESHRTNFISRLKTRGLSSRKSLICSLTRTASTCRPP